MRYATYLRLGISNHLAGRILDNGRLYKQEQSISGNMVRL